MMPPRTEGQWMRDLYGRHLARRARRRPLADLFSRATNHQIRWLTVAETVEQTRAGYYCEAPLCRRGVTCVVFFEYPRRGRLLFGETYCCTRHGERRAARYHVQIQDPPEDGETR